MSMSDAFGGGIAIAKRSGMPVHQLPVKAKSNLKDTQPLMNTNLLKRLIATTGAVALLAVAAQATPVAPGTSVVPTASATNPLTTGTIIANTGVQNFSVAGPSNVFSGTGQEWVVRNSATNPFGMNALTFVLQVSLGGVPPNSVGQVIERVTNSVFGSFLTDVMYFVSAAGQVTPGSADRSGTGQVVGFNFTSPNPNILPGQSSALLIINTNATGFTAGTLTVQDGLTANLLGYAPVPENGAGSAVLLLVGVGSLVFANRRLLKGSRASA
jgi:hypothetical protein